MKHKPHIANNSGNQEWITPSFIIALANMTMGGLDLDPASSHKANEVVCADKYYTIEDDGLKQDWYGKVWLNPPYSAKVLPLFVDKAILEIQLDHVKELCVLVNNATETQWFQKLSKICNVMCFLNKRVSFLNQELKPKNTPLQGQVVLYYGENKGKFIYNFEKYGSILVRIN